MSLNLKKQNSSKIVIRNGYPALRRNSFVEANLEQFKEIVDKLKDTKETWQMFNLLKILKLSPSTSLDRKTFCEDFDEKVLDELSCIYRESKSPLKSILRKMTVNGLKGDIKSFYLLPELDIKFPSITGVFPLNEVLRIIEKKKLKCSVYKFRVKDEVL